MKIAMINIRDIKGGASKVAYSLAKEMEKRGNKVDIFVGKKLSDDPSVHLISRENAFLKFTKNLTGKDISRRARELFRSWKNTDIDGFNVKGLNDPSFKEAEIVHLHNLQDKYFNLSLLPSISKDKKTIWTLHDMWAITGGCSHALLEKTGNNSAQDNFEGNFKDHGFFLCPIEKTSQKEALKYKKEREAKRKIYAASNLTIVAPSLWLKKKVEGSALGDKSIIHIPNGINTNIFKERKNEKNGGENALKNNLRKSLNLPENKTVILLVLDGGKGNPWKGYEYVEKVMAHYTHDNNIVFVIIGGEEKSRTEKMIEVGYVESPQMLADYYHACDLLLFTSIAENFPLVILEAMACGLPIVSFDVGGVKEVLEHKINGYISRYRDTDDLMNGIDFILKMQPNELEKMKKNSLTKISNHYSLEKMADAYQKLYYE